MEAEPQKKFTRFNGKCYTRVKLSDPLAPGDESSIIIVHKRLDRCRAIAEHVALCINFSEGMPDDLMDSMINGDLI